MACEMAHSNQLATGPFESLLRNEATQWHRGCFHGYVPKPCAGAIAGTKSRSFPEAFGRDVRRSIVRGQGSRPTGLPPWPTSSYNSPFV